MLHTEREKEARWERNWSFLFVLKGRCMHTYVYIYITYGPIWIGTKPIWKIGTKPIYIYIYKKKRKKKKKMVKKKEDEDEEENYVRVKLSKNEMSVSKLNGMILLSNTCWYFLIILIFNCAPILRRTPLPISLCFCEPSQDGNCQLLWIGLIL